MDHMMPVMDGVEATREIRKLGKEYEKLPVIALTANAVSGMKEMFLQSGFNGFISKPIIIQELDEVLKEFMSPGKITERAEQKAQDTDETYNSFINNVGKIGEINIEIGLNQLLGNKSTYYNTLNIFYNKLLPECDNMTASLEAKDLQNFTISVHAMKSMLAIIGAVGLSETALALQTASKNQEIDFCTRQFPQLKEELLTLHKQLSALFSDTAESSRSKTPESDGKKKLFAGKVLLVDDKEMILYVIGEKLLSYGLQVDKAESGSEAVEKAKSGYDLVFMDYMMPVMNGIEATGEIRKWEKETKAKNRLPIIALSADEDSGAEKFFLDNDFDGFLSKPINNEKLEEVLEKWLS